MNLINYIAGLGLLSFFLYLFVTPLYLLYIKTNYRELWQTELDIDLLPYLGMSELFGFIIKNKFELTNNRSFIIISYIYKYTFLITFVIGVLMWATPLISYLEQFEFMTRIR